MSTTGGQAPANTKGHLCWQNHQLKPILSANATQTLSVLVVTTLGQRRRVGLEALTFNNISVDHYGDCQMEK
jgi:hypothetical protein